MSRKNRDLVKLDTEDLTGVEYTCERVRLWSESMRVAVSADLQEEGKSSDEYQWVYMYRYARECEEVIRDLIFQLKWAQINLKVSEHADQG